MKGPRTPGSIVFCANVARKEGAIRIPTQGGWTKTGEISPIQILRRFGWRGLVLVVSVELLDFWGFGNFCAGTLGLRLYLFFSAVGTCLFKFFVGFVL
ncbi:hypothetical protein U1Q18_024818 [Sarracenia purpurea var. burkii]